MVPEQGIGPGKVTAVKGEKQQDRGERDQCQLQLSDGALWHPVFMLTGAGESVHSGR